MAEGKQDEHLVEIMSQLEAMKLSLNLELKGYFLQARRTAAEIGDPVEREAALAAVTAEEQLFKSLLLKVWQENRRIILEHASKFSNPEIVKIYLDTFDRDFGITETTQN